MAKNASSNLTYVTNENHKVDKFVFTVGIALLLLLLLIVLVVETFLKKDITIIGYEVIKILMCVSAALVFSQIPGILQVNLPLGVKAAGGIAFGVIIYFFAPNRLSQNNIPIVKAIPKKTNSVRIVVLKSADYEYGYTILYNFLSAVKDSIHYSEYELETPTVLTGTSDSYKNSAVKLDFYNKVESIFKRDTFDYYVTIGSSASKALHDYVKIHRKKIKHIFLGVTDPISLGLVNSLGPDRQDTRHLNIGGVAYCGNYEELPNKIHQLFPDKKLCYIYNTSILEDEQIAQRISQLDLINSGILTIKPISHTPVLADFSDRNQVYFSWSTFDDTFANDVKLINEVKNIVSTTSTHVEYGLVPIAVTTNDELIGEGGAGILLKNLMQKIPLENIDVIIPKWETYINVRMAGKFNIPYPIIRSCDHKF